MKKYYDNKIKLISSIVKYENFLKFITYANI